MTALAKYHHLRSQIKAGDIVLFRSNKLIPSRCIQWLDKAYYNHAGIVFEAEGRLFILDSNAPGVHPDFLSLRLKEYADFCIIRPLFNEEKVHQSLQQTFKKADKGIRYDYGLLVQIALYRLSGTKENFHSKNHFICSEFVRKYTNYLQPAPNCYTKPAMPTTFITPWDLLIYADKNFEVLFDESNKNSYRKAVTG
jgi:hypothetical protein